MKTLWENFHTRKLAEITQCSSVEKPRIKLSNILEETDGSLRKLINSRSVLKCLKKIESLYDIIERSNSYVEQISLVWDFFFVLSLLFSDGLVSVSLSLLRLFLYKRNSEVIALRFP